MVVVVLSEYYCKILVSAQVRYHVKVPSNSLGSLTYDGSNPPSPHPPQTQPDDLPHQQLTLVLLLWEELQ